MSETMLIARHKPQPAEYSFDHLRDLGIKYVQELSGNVWTDYNTHDPGVTLLEQICYALTEVIYRSDFAVADLLVDKQGDIDWQRQSLLPSETALPSRSVTQLDYRAVILNEVREVENVRLEVLKDKKDKPTGLYTILLRLRSETAGLGMEGPGRPASAKLTEEQIVEKVRLVFARNRNLCEDIHSVSVIPTADYKLKAEVEVKESSDPAEILATIYYVCGVWLASGIEFITYDRAFARGTTPEEMFRGPFVSSGMATRSVLRSRRRFPASEVYSLIKDIPGVETVKAFPGQIDTNGVVEPLLRLYWPRTDDEIGVKILVNRREVKVSLHDLVMRFEELSFANRGLRAESSQSVIPLPLGKVCPLEDYASIQYGLPSMYGVGPSGVPRSAAARQKAQIRQLRAYLLFFDQYIADTVATLGNLRHLYSTKIDKHETYFHQALDGKSFPHIDEVYGPDSLGRLRESVGSHRHANRAARLLDYLLALYGETFFDDPLLESGLDGNATNKQSTIEARIAYLRDIAAVTRDRSAAPDYSRAGPQVRSGMERKLTHLLGFEKHPHATGGELRVVEHILLRPENWLETQAEYVASFRISVLLPSWLPRCKDPTFRKFASVTVDSCCPAHIYPDIFWLSQDEAARFDELHKAWWPDRLPEHSKRLLAFLLHLEKREESS